MSDKIVELYTIPTNRTNMDWATIVADQHCTYLNRKCQKTRKSEPDVTIGTCSVYHGSSEAKGIIICPFRFLERSQVFFDCLHLLTLHEPGNELHRISEVEIPGGNVDYFLVSVRDRKVIDFVGIEFQTMDTTGTIWPARQQFLKNMGLPINFVEPKPYGMNWKMTAKTILIQLHHKAETFQQWNKHLVLVVQDPLQAYMKSQFNFSGLHPAKLGDVMHFHSYAFRQTSDHDYRLSLDARESTDLQGLTTALGLQASPGVDFELILSRLQAKLTDKTLLQFS